MTPPKGYSRTQIALHWGAAILIVLQFVLHEPIADAWRIMERGGQVAFDPIVSLHVFGGIAVLALAVWRLVLRSSRGVPPPPEAEPARLKVAAHLTHLSLYVLLILMPITGIFAWFGGVEAAAEVHEALRIALLALVALHVAAALWHQFWLKDGLMLRMKRAED